MSLSTKLLHALGPDLAVALADDDADTFPDPAVLQAALEGALSEAQIEFDRVGAVLPAEPGEAVSDLLVTLAIERLFLRRRELIPGAWAGRIARARQILAEIGAGLRPVGARDRVMTGPADDAPVRPARRLL